jgi:phytoene synthase
MSHLESDVFKQGSKTFSWAAALFPQRVLTRVESIYAFLRWADDLAEKKVASDRTRLEALLADPKQALEQNGFVRVAELLENNDVPRDALEEFIKCMVLDCPPLQLKSEEALLRYCYGAAGTVGLILTKIFEVQDSRAYVFAIDLGVAMQLTNIVRDVFEDYENQKIYLPEFCNQPPHSMSDEELSRIKRKYIRKAELFYESARQGLVYLPFRVGLAVGLASALYRRIGRKSLDPRFLRSRAVTSLFEKAYLSFVFFVRFLAIDGWIERRVPHHSELHQQLQGLPYVDSRL